MPKGLKIKSKQIKKVMDVGGSILSDISLPSLSFPIYVCLREQVIRFIKILNIIKNLDLHENQIIEIEDYVKYIEHDMEIAFRSYGEIKSGIMFPVRDIIMGKLNYKNLRDEDYPGIREFLNTEYNDSKKCNPVNIILVMCKNLTPYKKYIKNVEELDGKFLVRGASQKFDLIPQLSVNFSRLYINSDSEKTKQTILMVLNKLYDIGRKAFLAISEPDTDPNDICQFIVSQLDNLRGKLPRCNAAFDLIAGKTELLRKNFKSYHMDSMISGNKAMFVEHFLSDIKSDMAEESGSLELKMQLRDIIDVVRNSQPKNSKSEGLFAAVERKLTEFKTSSISGDYDDEESDDEESDDEESDEDANSVIITDNENNNLHIDNDQTTDYVEITTNGEIYQPNDDQLSTN